MTALDDPLYTDLAPDEEAFRDLDPDELDWRLDGARYAGLLDSDGGGQLTTTVSTAADSTWVVRDLTAALAGTIERTLPDMLRRHDGQGLAYTARINGIQGDSGSGKSMLVVHGAAEHMADGGHVVWIDLEDPNEELIIERLRAFGVADDVIADQFHYVNPAEAATTEGVDALVADADAFGHCVVVFDSIGESMGLQNLDENKDLDVDWWKRLLPHRFERAGHTVWLIDHINKDGANALFASGSKRKRALISGACWLLEVVTPFSRDHPGKLKLVCAKDRQGTYRRGEIGAWVHVDPTGEHLQVLIEAPNDTETATDNAGPAVVLVPRVIATLKSAGPEGLSLKNFRAEIRRKAKASNQVIDDAGQLAERLGCIRIGPGPRTKSQHYFVRDLTAEDKDGLTND